MTNNIVEKIRLQKIDLLRAVSTVGMIAIHVFSFSLYEPVNKFIWNYLHFVVVGFVFCSGYILSLNSDLATNSFIKNLSWYKKRFIRLLIPFYLYLLTHFSLWIIFPQYFSGLGLEKNINFILSSIILTGGVGIGWLTVLFLELTIISPFILKFWNNKKILFSYIVFCLVVTMSFTVWKFPYEYYRWVMWIPWSLILILGIWMYEYEVVKKFKSLTFYIKIAASSYIIFFLLFYFFTLKGKTILLIDHKYPPDFFNLSYGVFICSIILIIGNLKLFKNEYIEKAYKYISANSYQMFFIHFPVLDFILKISGEVTDPSFVSIRFLLTLSVTIIISFMLNKLRGIFYQTFQSL